MKGDYVEGVIVLNNLFISEPRSDMGENGKNNLLQLVGHLFIYLLTKSHLLLLKRFATIKLASVKMW